MTLLVVYVYCERSQDHTYIHVNILYCPHACIYIMHIRVCFICDVCDMNSWLLYAGMHWGSRDRGGVWEILGGGGGGELHVVKCSYFPADVLFRTCWCCWVNSGNTIFMLLLLLVLITTCTMLLLFVDIAELNLPKTCQLDFPDPDDLLNFRLIICPDEVSRNKDVVFIIYQSVQWNPSMWTPAKT